MGCLTSNPQYTICDKWCQTSKNIFIILRAFVHFLPLCHHTFFLYTPIIVLWFNQLPVTNAYGSFSSQETSKCLENTYFADLTNCLNKINTVLFLLLPLLFQLLKPNLYSGKTTLLMYYMRAKRWYIETMPCVKINILWVKKMINTL